MSIKATMKREHKPRSGMALGGIGTGGFELRQDGTFYNWHIFNNKPFGTGSAVSFNHDSMLFFVVRYQEQGRNPQMKLLQIDEGHEVASIPSHIYTFPWLTGIDRIDYEASYPFTKIRFSDADMPFVIELEAFTPFIPHDVKNSSLPAAIFNFTIVSKAKRPVDVMLLCSMRNGIGYDVDTKRFASRVVHGRGMKVIEMGTDMLDPTHSSAGTQALASLSSDSTYYVGWSHRHPYYETVIRSSKLPNKDDTEGRNFAKHPKHEKPLACGDMLSSIAVSRRLKTEESFDHTFLVAWNLPNLYAGLTPKEERSGKKPERRIEGYYYSNFFDTATDVATYVKGNLEKLTERTRAFHDNFFDSSLPSYALDQVNSQLNTFVTSAWLTKAFDFGIQEGLTPQSPFGPLATIDVALYGSFSTAALFPELDKAMMRAHKRLQRKTGEICHGIGRNFSMFDTAEGVTGRLDLPSQYVILALRAYLWTGDMVYLKEMWPSVKKALNYVLRERDANGDLLPDMGGSMCTYDNFPMYGAAAYVASLWLAALRYAVDAARALGDTKSATRYADVLGKGEAVFEEKLWNGSYYRLYNDEGGPRGDMDEGCLTDQIIGQWTTHFVGFESLLKPTHVRRALREVMAMAYRRDYGLLNCRWPADKWLQDVPETCWSDQANTCWTGVELAFASFLIYEGMVKEGFAVIRNVDDRYRKAGMYWDHQEFGGHYFRPMSAWANINAALGLAINGDRYRFCPRIDGKHVRLFFAFGDGTAHFIREASKKKEKCRIAVRSGTLRCREIRVGLRHTLKGDVRVRVADRELAADAFEVIEAKKELTVRLKRRATVRAGQELVIVTR